MISKIFEHSTRNISFSVDELKAWTEEDEQLVFSYLKIHDREQYLTDRGKLLDAERNRINAIIEQTREALSGVEIQIKDISKLADTFSLVHPKKEEKAKEILGETVKVSETINAYQQLFIESEKNIAELDEANTVFIDEIEDITLWDEYGTVKHAHFKNYENNSIDIVSFDREDDLFRGYASFHKQRHHDVFERVNECIRNYNALLSETKTQYGMWEEYLKRIVLIRAIAENDDGYLMVSVN